MGKCYIMLMLHRKICTTGDKGYIGQDAHGIQQDWGIPNGGVRMEGGSPMAILLAPPPLRSLVNRRVIIAAL